MSERTFSAKDVADILKIEKRSVTRIAAQLREQGIECGLLVGNSLAFTPEEIERIRSQVCYAMTGPRKVAEGE